MKFIVKEIALPTIGLILLLLLDILVLVKEKLNDGSLPSVGYNAVPIPPKRDPYATTI